MPDSSQHRVSPQSAAEEAGSPVLGVSDRMILEPGILDQMHDAVVITDLAGNIQSANRAVATLYGFTPEDLNGTSLADLSTDEERRTLEAAIVPAVTASGEFRGELRHHTRGGRDIYVHASISLLHDSSGRPAGMLGVFLPIAPQKPGDPARRRTDHVDPEATLLMQSSASMHLLVQAVERAEDVVLITEAGPLDDPGPRIIYVNAAFYRTTGYSHDEIIGHTPRILQGPGSDRAALDRIRDALEHWAPIREELLNYRKDGSQFWVDLSIVPLADGEGIFTHWIAIQRDITDQYLVRQQLLASESRLRLGMEVASLALVEIDYETGLYHLSAEAARLFGLGTTATALPRAVVNATCHPDDREALEQGIASCLDPSGPGSFSMDHRVVWPSGQIHWLRVRKQVYFTGEGSQRRPLRATFAAFDVTSDHKNVERLVDSEAQLRVLTEALPQLVWAADGTGKKIFCNQRYFDYTGAASTDELNALWITYIHPDDQLLAAAAWLQALKTGDPYLCEYRLKRRDGTFRHFLVRANPMRDSYGKITRWLGSSTDVHDQKLSETALRRTEKLAATGRLASNIAHEINNPLSGAINSLYVALLDPRLDESTRGHLQQAEAELLRVAHVTDVGLSFYKQSAQPALANVADIMNSVLLLFAGRLAAHAIEVRTTYRQRTDLSCCKEEIRQVFANLISNALDAMPFAGRLLIRIGYAHTWDSARQRGVRVTVADTGSGIPPEVRDRIFDPFVSTKEATGTGLGLWVSHDLVRKHRGSISLRSSTDPLHLGTVFSIFFPLDGVA